MEEEKTNQAVDSNLNPQEQKAEGSFFKEKESKAGPMIGSIIVIIVIIVAGIYFWSIQVEEKKNNEEANQMLEQEPFEESQTDPIEEANQIEGELELLETDFEDIEAELEAIDREFEDL